MIKSDITKRILHYEHYTLLAKKAHRMVLSSCNLASPIMLKGKCLLTLWFRWTLARWEWDHRRGRHTQMSYVATVTILLVKLSHINQVMLTILAVQILAAWTRESRFHVSDKFPFAHKKTWSETPEYVYTSSLIYI